MEELLDPDGVWSEDLIALMLAVAIDLEADQAEAMFGAVGAAASGLFGKEAPQAFSKGIERIRGHVRAAQRRARGMVEGQADGQEQGAGSGPDVADAMLELARKMGMHVPRKRPKSGPGNPGPSRGRGR